MFWRLFGWWGLSSQGQVRRRRGLNWRSSKRYNFWKYTLDRIKGQRQLLMVMMDAKQQTMRRR